MVRPDLELDIIYRSQKHCNVLVVRTEEEELLLAEPKVQLSQNAEMAWAEDFTRADVSKAVATQVATSPPVPTKRRTTCVSRWSFGSGGLD